MLGLLRFRSVTAFEASAAAKKCYRDGRGRLRTEEQSKRADAFLLENLRILQDANAHRVRRVGDHQ
jgi:hypothetical protein